MPPVAGLVRPAPRALEVAEHLTRGVVGDIAELDRRIAAAAEHWRVSRIALVERNILRLGIHELAEGATPPKVVIDEAVRLARWFGGPQAPAFVNGVLDRAAHDMGRLAAR